MKKDFVPTPANVRADIEAVINKPWLMSLYGRWQDEHEYEDWEEYKKTFVRLSGFTLISATKRPFAFKFKHKDFPDAVYQIKVTSRYIEWGRLG